MKQILLRNGMPLGQVFKDPRPLEDDFIPHKIQYRDSQIQILNYHLLGLIRYGLLMKNIVVHGPPGTGKTHSVKNVLSNIKEEINSFYGCAYRSTSAHAFFRGFLERNFNLCLHPRESISVYYRAFEKAVNNMKSLLLVFDDIQYLLNGDPKGIDGLLFYLSRLGKNLGLIIIGNIVDNDLSMALEPPTTSSLRLRLVHFPKYNAKELEGILMDRARDALTQKALKRSKPAIARIAAFTAQSWGSARYALDLLREATIVSEAMLGENYISQEAVERAVKILETSIVEEQIRCLPPQPFAVLEAIQRMKEKKGLSTGDVYSTYNEICPCWGLTPFSLRKVSDFITELDSLGLISCRLVSKGRLGRTRLISWLPNRTLEVVYERVKKERFLESTNI